jgi:hypothetical protein
VRPTEAAVPNKQQEIRYRLPEARNTARKSGRKPAGETNREPAGPQLPRITRLMALAIQLQGLKHEHADLSDQDLARLGHVSAPRLTQILNLLHLAPDLQERLLWLEPNPKGRDRVHEPALRRLTKLYDWRQQRLAFEAILAPARVSPDARAPSGGRYA